jgi:hypothetical protein
MPGPSQSYTKDPVYCSECHWLDTRNDSINKECYTCRHPNNRNPKKDTWFRKDKTGYKKPWKINKKNKCHWYEVRGSRLSGGGKKLL